MAKIFQILTGNNNNISTNHILGSIQDSKNVLNSFFMDVNAAAIPLHIATDKDMTFQTPASPTMNGLVSFHDDLMFFLAVILFFVMYCLAVCLLKFNSENHKFSERLVHASTLEIIWTIIPAMVLVVISFPSFGLLYSIDEIINPEHTIKVIGHQWYWSYEWVSPATLFENEASEERLLDWKAEVKNLMTTSFDSYMLSDDEVVEYNRTYANEIKEAKVGEAVRLLSTDNNLALPAKMPLRALISSSDVLHSWAIPSLGVKVDACPGRLNQATFMIDFLGFYFGQCSEICGVGHGFMPISIYSFLLDDDAGNVNAEADYDNTLISLQSLLHS